MAFILDYSGELRMEFLMSELFLSDKSSMSFTERENRRKSICGKNFMCWLHFLRWNSKYNTTNLIVNGQLESTTADKNLDGIMN